MKSRDPMEGSVFAVDTTWPETDSGDWPARNSYFVPTSITPSSTIQFTNDGKIIGTLDFNQAPMTFTGDADESARALFDALDGFFVRAVKKQTDELLTALEESGLEYSRGKIREKSSGLEVRKLKEGL